MYIHTYITITCLAWQLPPAALLFFFSQVLQVWFRCRLRQVAFLSNPSCNVGPTSGAPFLLQSERIIVGYEETSGGPTSHLP